MKRFILLLNHDDKSLTEYLQRCLEKGEKLEKVSGNIFTFQKEPYDNSRIAVVTYANDDPDLKMKFQIEDYSALMKKRGWRTLCVGGPEDIFDSKRHVFLITDQAEIPFPMTSTELARKANRREERSLIRCIAMLLLLLGFAIFFIHHDPDVLLASSHILISGAAAFVFCVASWIFCGKGVTRILRKDRDFSENSFLNIDKAVFCCLAAIICILVGLLIDLYRYPDTGKTVLTGEQRFMVYNDDLPLTLEDLDLPVKGAFRSSRKTDRKSFLAESLTASDQSFSDPKGTDNLSLVSYTLIRCRWQPLLRWIAARKGMNRFPVTEDMNGIWHSSEVHSDQSHRLTALYPDSVLFLSSSGDISETDPEIVLEKLSINETK